VASATAPFNVIFWKRIQNACATRDEYAGKPDDSRGSPVYRPAFSSAFLA
jgi:hypothetical protein